MSKFKPTAITTEFINAAADAAKSGKEISMTTAIASQATVTDDQIKTINYSSSQSVSKDITTPISNYYRKDGTSTLVLEVAFTNKTLAKDVNINTILLFGTYDGKDILIGVSRLNNAELIPAFDGSIVTLEYDLFITFQNSYNVQVLANDAGLATNKVLHEVDNSAVHKNGDETIYDKKKFIQPIIGSFTDGTNTVSVNDVKKLQSRADGFDATVTKVNNLQAGGRNLFIGSKTLSNSFDINSNATFTREPFDDTTTMLHIKSPQGSGTFSGIYLDAYAKNMVSKGDSWSFSIDIKGTGNIASIGIENSINVKNYGSIKNDWSRISSTGVANGNNQTVDLYFDTSNSPLDVYVKLPKLENGNLPSSYTEALEDINSSISKAQQTADKVNNSSVKITGDQTIKDIKTFEKPIVGSFTDGNNIVSVADIKKLQQRADNFDATVTKVNGLSVGGRNLLLASANMPNNLSGWNSVNKAGDTYQGLTIAEVNYAWGGPKYKIADLLSRQVINGKDTYTLSTYVRNTSDNDVDIEFNGTDNVTAFTYPNSILVSKIKAHSDWTRISVSFSFINLDKLNNTSIRFEPRWNVTNGAIGQVGLKLETGSLATDYTQAPEDVDSSISKAQQMADRANNSSVKITGDQTIKDTKTFEKSIVGNLQGNADTATRTSMIDISNNTNLDDLRDNGNYSLGVNNVYNSPVDHWFTLVVVKNGDFNGTQTLTDTNSGSVWIRTWSNTNKFTSWEKMSKDNTVVHNSGDQYIDGRVNAKSFGGNADTATSMQMQYISKGFHVDGIKNSGTYSQIDGDLNGLPEYPIWGILEVIGNGNDVMQKFNVTNNADFEFCQRHFSLGHWSDWKKF